MPAPRKYDTETRARAVRMYRDRLTDHGESMIEARRQSARCSTSTHPRCAAGSNATTSTTATATA